MAQPQIPDDVLRVNESELREKLSSLVDRVAYADEEVVVMRDGKPIAAVVRMGGLRALRRMARESAEQLGDERLGALVGSNR